MRTALTILFACLSTPAFAQDVSVEAGERIAIIGGCHDCHTVGFAEAGGVADPATALKGNPVGFQGPWGTTYAVNLRLVAADKSEDEWVEYLTTLQARPPMPAFNLKHFTEDELRSLHQYILSLGEPGEPAPEFVPPGGKVTSPYLVFVPVMPPGQ